MMVSSALFEPLLVSKVPSILNGIGSVFFVFFHYHCKLGNHLILRSKHHYSTTKPIVCMKDLGTRKYDLE